MPDLVAHPLHGGAVGSPAARHIARNPTHKASVVSSVT
jgi:hypothetical protein